jgi:hypothetical protein
MEKQIVIKMHLVEYSWNISYLKIQNLKSISFEHQHDIQKVSDFGAFWILDKKFGLGMHNQ